MSIHLELIEDGKILWFQIEGSWTPQEIVAAKEKTQQIFRSARQPIHALVDLSKASINMALLKASQQVMGGEPVPNVGQIVVIGVPRLMRMLAEPLLRMASSDPITFLNTFEEAKAYLQSQPQGRK